MPNTVGSTIYIFLIKTKVRRPVPNSSCHPLAVFYKVAKQRPGICERARRDWWNVYSL